MFETVMFLELMEKLQKKCHQNSKDKGFWEGAENQSVPTKLMLIVSECSEWLEAFRGDPKAPCGKIMPEVKINEKLTIASSPLSVIEGAKLRPVTKEEEEAADILIRLCDLCGWLGIDLGRVTLAKMEYNATRSPMHGGKKC